MHNPGSCGEGSQVEGTARRNGRMHCVDSLIVSFEFCEHFTNHLCSGTKDLAGYSRALGHHNLQTGSTGRCHLDNLPQLSEVSSLTLKVHFAWADLQLEGAVGLSLATDTNPGRASSLEADKPFSPDRDASKWLA